MKSIDDILAGITAGQPRAIGRAITLVENQQEGSEAVLSHLDSLVCNYLVLGITGPPGAGKSTLTSRLIEQYRADGERVGVIAIDPSSPLSGGAILGDRIRMMRHAKDPDVVIRSMATRGRLGGLCSAAGSAVRIMAASGCSKIIIETVGVGQSEMDIIGLADLTLLALAPGLGDDIQAMKAGLLEVVDLLVVNKNDLRGAENLAMDLEGVARQREDKYGLPTRVCRTIASEGQGIEHSESGEMNRRRQVSRNREVVDWGLDMIREKLEPLAALHKHEASPQKTAVQLLQKLWLDL